MTYVTTPLHKSPYARGHEIINLVSPFLGHHYFKLSFFRCMPESREFF